MIRRHYNRAAQETAQERSESDHLALRRFHNALKLTLLRLAMQDAPYIDSVLDVACGRGGDVSKWASLNARHYTGIDIAQEALATARQRYAHLSMPQRYLCADMHRHADYTEEEGPARRHTAISVQFALQYVGKIKTRFHALWRAWAGQLAPGPASRVICTFTDALVLARVALTAMRRDGICSEKDVTDGIETGNNMVRLYFPVRTCRALFAVLNGKDPPWGLEVRWQLGHLVDASCVEYLLWPHHVDAAVRAAGLRVRDTRNFHAFAYQERVPTGRGLTHNEWFVSRLYRTLVAEHSD